MIYTSYFGKLRKLPKNVLPVAICAKIPDWYTGLQYTPLAPRYDLLMKWKDDHNEDDYIQCFNNTTLSNLNIIRVLSDLHSLLPEDAKASMLQFVWNSDEYHIALVCYEKAGDFCHRHIVANWLREYDIECEEWEE